MTMINDLWFIPILFVTMGLGFLSYKIWKRRAVKEWSEEMEELETRLANARKLMTQYLNPAAQGLTAEYGVGAHGASMISKQRTHEAVERTGGREPRKVSNRRVRLTKISGRDRGAKLGVTFVGLEESLPEVGKRYTVLDDKGDVFRTSCVRQKGAGYIIAEDALYQLEVFSEKGKPDEWRKISFIQEHLENIKKAADRDDEREGVHEEDSLSPERDVQSLGKDSAAAARPAFHKTLTCLLWGWVLMGITVNLVAMASVMISSENLLDAAKEISLWYSPLNLSSWLLELILFTPAAGIYWLRSRLTKREERLPP